MDEKHGSVTERNKKISTAHHEAGHAVASCLWFRRAFKSVTVEGSEDFRGRLVGKEPGEWFEPEFASTDTRVRRRIEEEIMILWAGPLTQERFVGEFDDAGAGYWRLDALGRDETVLMPGSDLHSIVHLADFVTKGDPDETSAFIEWLRLRTEREMKSPGWHFWECVEALAGALLEHRTLSYLKARDVILGTQRMLMQEEIAKHKVFGAK